MLGGTFDPVHVGHLVAAVDVRHALALDRVLLMVANRPWQKEGRTIAPAEDRYRMVADSTADIEGVEASRLEIERGGDTYTVETLESLALQWPGADLFCVVGSDVAGELHTWHRAERVRELATMVVVSRPGSEGGTPGPGWRVRELAIPRLDVSSTAVRDRAAEGRPIHGLVPTPAVHWIRRQGLYSGGG